MVLKKILLLILLCFSVATYGQQRKIKILKSELSYSDEDKHPGATILIGKVKIQHAGAILYCKKAFYYRENNFFKAIFIFFLIPM